DPILGHRIGPDTAGHDSLGFRNPRVPVQADVVVLGDSQTYGFGAAREGSWPQQLAGLLGGPVYSMALGGYGPMEYLYLMRNPAKKLQSKQFVVGFYFGNDLMDACYAVEGRTHWAGWRSSPAVACASASSFAGGATPTKRLGAWRDWLAGHSVLYGVLKATVLRRLATWEKDQAAAQVTQDVQMLWKDPAQPATRTIFMPQQRLAVVDPESPGVQEGLRITKRAFEEMRDEAATQRARLLVVMIPTKERVYCAYLARSGAELPPAYARLCEAEERVAAELTRHLTASAITYTDALPALREQTMVHAQIYPTDAEGHPLPVGYSVIASVVFAAMRSP
ncbi:MAG: hypothetical protein ABIV63_00910, partial [Caldimonas sp.]